MLIIKRYQERYIRVQMSYGTIGEKSFQDFYLLENYKYVCGYIKDNIRTLIFSMSKVRIIRNKKEISRHKESRERVIDV